MSWYSKVIWSEGMFLQPQHLQQHDRYLERMIEGRVQPVGAYAWGYTDLVLDEAALALGKISIASGAGIFPDGTPFDFPACDGAPLPLEIPADAKNETVFLGVPLRRAGNLEVDLDGSGEANSSRYTTGEIEVFDTVVDPERSTPVQVGQLRLKLLLGRDALDGYATLGAIRVTERRADRQVVLDEAYIPPTLSIRGNTVLSGYIDEIHGLLHHRGEALAAHLSQPGRGGVAEIADFLMLQMVNGYQPLFAHLGSVPVLHPERLFSLYLMLAGDLATFTRDNRRPPGYPPYNHDDLRNCFEPLVADIRRSLSMVLEQSAIPIELQPRKYGVRVAIISDQDLLRTASFVMAANAELPGETLRVRFPSQVKIGPVERIRDLVNLQLPGIVLRPLPVAPRQIPYHAGFSYFNLERDGDLWKQLQHSGGLALHVAGDFPGLELQLWAIRS